MVYNSKKKQILRLLSYISRSHVSTYTFFKILFLYSLLSCSVYKKIAISFLFMKDQPASHASNDFKIRSCANQLCQNKISATSCSVSKPTPGEDFKYLPHNML